MALNVYQRVSTWFSFIWTCVTCMQYNFNPQGENDLLYWSYFFYFLFFIFKLYITVLVLPNIKMNPPQVYWSYFEKFFKASQVKVQDSGSFNCATEDGVV